VRPGCRRSRMRTQVHSGKKIAPWQAASTGCAARQGAPGRALALTQSPARWRHLCPPRTCGGLLRSVLYKTGSGSRRLPTPICSRSRTWPHACNVGVSVTVHACRYVNARPTSGCARVLARVYFAGLLGWWAAKLLITYAACDSHRPLVGQSQLDLLASFQWCTPVLLQYLGMCSTLRPAKAFAMCRQDMWSHEMNSSSAKTNQEW